MQRRIPLNRLAVFVSAIPLVWILGGSATSQSTTHRKEVYDQDFERADSVINPALLKDEVREDQRRTALDEPKLPLEGLRGVERDLFSLVQASLPSSSI